MVPWVARRCVVEEEEDDEWWWCDEWRDEDEACGACDDEWRGEYGRGWLAEVLLVLLLVYDDAWCDCEVLWRGLSAAAYVRVALDAAARCEGGRASMWSSGGSSFRSSISRG